MSEMEEYLTNMSEIQASILNYIESESSSTKKLNGLLKLFDKYGIRSNKHNLKSILHIISNISDNHHHGPNFYERIRKILFNFQKDITKSFSNLTIFNIFKSNKKILYLLVKNKILIIEKAIASILLEDTDKIKYLFDFLKPFLDEERIQDIEEQLPDNYNEKTEYCENRHNICKLILNDDLDDFKSYIKKRKISLTSKIEESIFETNLFLIGNDSVSLIEYAAFYGSIQIFKYLLENGAKYDSNLWIYAIHSQSLEMIQLLEETGVDFDNYTKCIEEAIKCHHNEIFEYIKKKYGKKKKVNLTNFALQYYNISLIDVDSIDELPFFDLCKFDYCTLADVILRKSDFDINEVRIYTYITLIQFLYFFNFHRVFG